jgi:methylated-DNA-[protein]-cysteine S-methyltransferase
LPAAVTHDGAVQVDQLETPIGVVGVGATSRGLARVSFDGYRISPSQDDGDDVPAATAQLSEAMDQLAAYFDGSRQKFSLTIDWSGVTGLRLAVLQALHDTVTFGRTTTYGALASQAGSRDDARAVGGIMGSNPVPIVVGCHRVLASDSLGGFGGGLRTKEWLLAWEGSLTPTLDLGFGT